MVEGARLESVYTATYRGFESLLLRQYSKRDSTSPFFIVLERGFGENRLTQTNAIQGAFAFERYCWRPSRGESRYGGH